MPIEVETPDGNIAEFPDGMPPEQITAALRRKFPPPAAAAQPESTWEKLQQAATGLVGGALQGLESSPLPQGGVANPRPDLFPPKVEEPQPMLPAQSGAQKLGQVAGKSVFPMLVGAASGGLSIPLQSAALATSGVAQVGSAGGSPSEMTTTGVLDASAPLVGPLLEKVAGPVAKGLRGMAVKQYERALGATKDATKAEASRIAPELLDRGVTGSLKQLNAQATGQVSDIGQQIQASYREATKAGTKVDGNGLADALEALKTPFREMGKSGPVDLNPKAIGAIEDMQGILRELGDASPSAIWKFRKTVDDIVSASNGFTRELPGGTAKSIQKQVRGIIQEELNKAVPDVSRLNSEFRLWKGLQDVTAATMRRQTSQERNLIPAIIGAGGFGGVAATGSLAGAGGAGLAMAALTQLVRSPLWRTMSAVQKNALADVLSGGGQALGTEAGKSAATMLALFGAKGIGQPEPSLVGTQPGQ